MSKEKPEKFDDVLFKDFKWYATSSHSKDWKNVKYLKELGDYYMYFVHDDDNERGFIYRIKIKSSICDKCGQDLK